MFSSGGEIFRIVKILSRVAMFKIVPQRYYPPWGVIQLGCYPKHGSSVKDLNDFKDFTHG